MKREIMLSWSFIKPTHEKNNEVHKETALTVAQEKPRTRENERENERRKWMK